MEFHPVIAPIGTLTGIVILEAIIVFALTVDRKFCSRAYVAGLATLECSLIALLMASVSRQGEGILFWNAMLFISGAAYVPCGIWMGLETSGVRIPGLSAKAVFGLTMIPIAAYAAMILTNPAHRLYWSSVSFLPGNVMRVEYGPLVPYTAYFMQTLLIIGFALLCLGMTRHRGNERKRLFLFIVSLALMLAGDELFRFGIRLPLNIHPLSLFLSIGTAVIAISVFLYGFPRANAPIMNLTDENAAKPAIEELPRMSDRQREIVALVAEGNTYRAIAERVGLSERTVKYHMGQILDKFNIETREQLLVLLATRGPLRD